MFLSFLGKSIYGILQVLMLAREKCIRFCRALSSRTRSWKRVKADCGDDQSMEGGEGREAGFPRFLRSLEVSGGSLYLHRLGDGEFGLGFAASGVGVLIR